jgi:hypothetical protein
MLLNYKREFFFIAVALEIQMDADSLYLLKYIEAISKEINYKLFNSLNICQLKCHI